MSAHNYQLEIEKLVVAGILGNIPGKTDRVTLAHRSKSGRRGDTSALSQSIARRLKTRIIVVAHDDSCGAERGKRCDCSPNIIDRETGEVLNRRRFDDESN